jgi:phage gp29-like protein
MASLISQQRVVRYLQSRFNPIRQLTPEWLAQTIDSFQAGFLREFAMLSNTIEERDDVLQAVVPKRKKAIGRNGYEVVTLDDSPQAKKHQEALKYFYAHLTATDAIKEDDHGGFKLLTRQMADAIGKKYAVHEIVWQPQADGLTAEFRFAPLWFFENRTGKLRYLPQEGLIEGVDLNPDNWLITVGDGLMVACAIAYMFKNLSLKDWLIYCERFGMPIPIGETTAAKDSPEWTAMLQAVESIMAGAAAVKNVGEQITLLETKGHGDMPYRDLVERMDRMMASIWRGADLSTMSRGGGSSGKSAVGSSVQGEESEILEVDDTEWISETLNQKVSRFVINYTFGDEMPLAYLKVMASRKQDVQGDILVDQFLLDAGFPLTVSDVGERYGREFPAGSEEQMLVPKASVKDINNPDSTQSAMGNEADIEFEGARRRGDIVAMANALKKKGKSNMISLASKQFGEARRRDLAPVAARITSLLALADPTAQREAIIGLKSALPKFLKEANSRPRTAPVLAAAMSADFFNGIDEGAQERAAA